MLCIVYACLPCRPPLQGDFPASRMINAVPGVDEARKQRLIKVLDIDPEWRMHQVSDGQRRRVQICVGLLRPFKVRQPGLGAHHTLPASHSTQVF